MRVRRLLAAVCAVPLLVACQPDPTTPSATSTSPNATVTTSPTPSEEELFRQASDVYRRIRVEIDKLEAAGGAKELPPSLTQYVTGTLEANLAALYVDTWPRDQKRRTGEAPVVVWLRLWQQSAPSGNVVALHACVDASKAEIRYADGRVNKGIIQTQTFFFGWFGGQLKAFASKSEKVTTC